MAQYALIIPEDDLMPLKMSEHGLILLNACMLGNTEYTVLTMSGFSISPIILDI